MACTRHASVADADLVCWFGARLPSGHVGDDARVTLLSSGPVSDISVVLAPAVPAHGLASVLDVLLRHGFVLRGIARSKLSASKAARLGLGPVFAPQQGAPSCVVVAVRRAWADLHAGVALAEISTTGAVSKEHVAVVANDDEPDAPLSVPAAVWERRLQVRGCASALPPPHTRAPAPACPCPAPHR